MQKIGVFGGTFSPIHNGHLRLAQAAREHFSLDMVLFIPSGFSYMKVDSDILDAKTRLSMTRLAIADIPGFVVSDMEVMRPGPSYTCDTLRELSKQYPGLQIYYIVGSDTLHAMDAWKEPEYIFENTVVVVYARNDALPGQKSDELTKKYGADIRLIPGEPLDISSHWIREKYYQGVDIAALLPQSVLSHMDMERLGRLRCAVKEQLDGKRYEHSLGVCYMGAALAMCHGADIRKAQMAGLLHDWAKAWAADTLVEKCSDKGIPMRETERQNPHLLHAKLGAHIVREQHNIMDTDILGAIESHTTGRPGMTLLEKIIYVADYIEPGRYKAPRLGVIREKAFCNLDAALLMILEDSLEHLRASGRAIDPMTVETYEFYLKSVNLKREPKKIRGKT